MQRDQYVKKDAYVTCLALESLPAQTFLSPLRSL